MSKDLSKQLCELCGIEYEKHEPVVEIDSSISKYQIKTLDFIKPENFVKLYELETYGDKTVAGLISRHCRAHDVISFVQNLLWFCSTFERNSEGSEGVMKAIREAEWVYE